MLTPLEACLGITGQFEGGDGGPRWTLTCGNGDGQGVSAGCLQWCAGQGSLQNLLRLTLGDAAVAADDFAPIFALKDMPTKQAVPYAVAQWVDPTSRTQALRPEAKALWEALLGTPQCIAAQKDLASAILTKARTEAARFLPEELEIHPRAEAFFFDLRVQQGGMSKRREDGTWITPKVIATGAEATSAQKAIGLAHTKGKKQTAGVWAEAISADPLARILLHYAYERAILARPQYQWDALARRGTIACRQGQVHGQWFDLRAALD